MKRQTIAKLTTVILAALLSTLLISISIFAASTSATVSSSGKVARGNSITFNVKINNGSGIEGIAVIPSYDITVFDLVSGEWIITGGLMPDFSVENGDGVIAFNPAADINTAVLTFTLKAKSDAPLGNHTVSAEVIVTDSNGNSNLTVTGSTVEIQCNHNYLTNDRTYLKSEASCSSPALYFKICSICGEHNTETFQYGEKLAHTYTEKVADKYLKNAASCTKEAIYYVSCSVCGNTGTDTFESGTAKGHAYNSEWSTTGEQHWYECSNCNEKKDRGEHVFENGTIQECNVCGYKKCENHVFDTEWHRDNDSHWNECTLCRTKTNEAAHKWDNGTLTREATERFSGIKTYFCEDCAAEKIELTPALADSNNNTPNNNVNINNAADDNVVMMVIAIAEGVVIVILIVLLILKKKANAVVNESHESNENGENNQDDEVVETNDTNVEKPKSN